MNVLEFWGRLIWGGMLGILSVSQFSEKHPESGIAAIMTAFFIVLSPVSLRRDDQRPRPLSSLKNDFDIYMLLAWSRGILGLLLGVGAIGMLESTPKKEYNDTWAALIILVLGWLLVSPLGDRVFTYSRHDKTTHGKWSWSSRSGVLYLARFAGLIITMCGAGILNGKDANVPDAIFVLIAGVALIFIKQIKYFFSGIKQAPRKPTPIVRLKPPVYVKEVKPEQPAPVITTVSQPVEAEVKKASNLAEHYKALQLLPLAEKGKAFGTFLNRLFDTEGLMTSGDFTVKETVISGSFELEGQIYILSAKWGTEKSDEDALLVFNSKVESRSTWARGIFISEAGFTNDGLALFAQGKRTSIIGMDGRDLQLVVEGKLSLTDAIKRKARRAVETNNFFVPLRELI